MRFGVPNLIETRNLFIEPYTHTLCMRTGSSSNAGDQNGGGGGGGLFGAVPTWQSMSLLPGGQGQKDPKEEKKDPKEEKKVEGP